jgi:hypothetical protein
MPPKFELGQIVYTPGARDLLFLNGISPLSLLKRHVDGDWGELSEEDKQENELSVKEGFRILSSYPVGTEKVWIITEADRSATTLLLPSEY